MKTVITFLALAFLFGCDDPNPSIKPDEWSTIAKIRSGTYELISKNDLEELRKNADLGRRIGRYQLHREPVRTWRFDTATGQVCLLLSTETDLKKPETSEQVCPSTAEELEFGPDGKLRKK